MTEDRRTARTRRALHQALMALIVRKGYDAVTVQDIIDEADVGRSTFYAHYAGKEALLRGGFQTLRAELSEARAASAERHEPPGAPLAFSLALFEHACGYQDVYLALVGGRGGLVAITEIRRILSELVRQELSATKDKDGAAIPRELRVQFIVGTLLTVLTWMLERSRRPSPADADAIFRQLVIGGIGPIAGPE